MSDEETVLDGAEAPSESWPLVKRLLFPFAFAFVLISCAPFPLTYLLGFASRLAAVKAVPEERRLAVNAVVERASNLLEAAAKHWDDLILAVGKRVHGLDITVRPLGSGDTTWNFVDLEVRAALAGVLGLLWLVLFRRCRAFPKTGRFLSIYTRWCLLLTMFGYGLAKVIPVQMPYPGMRQLLTTYADSSPMGLVWRFIGISPAYSIFVGLGEVVGGVLLAFRRTTTLGAVVLTAVMANVVYLNFAYDVPVKLYPSLLLVMALGLLAADGGRLIDFFLRHRFVAETEFRPLFGWRAFDRLLTVLKIALVCWLAYDGYHGNSERRVQQEARRAEAPFRGVFDVTSFTTDGVEKPLLVTDATGWRQLVFDYKGSLSIRRMDDRWITMGFEPDPSAKSITVTDYAKSAPASRPASAPASAPTSSPTSAPAAAVKSLWRYSTPEPDVLVLEGEYEGHAVVIRARDMKRTYLMPTRGFHWINETPLNR